MTTGATPSTSHGAVPVADLHAHTTASDGLLSPSELVAQAKTAGLAAIAITDHDTVDGVAEAIAAAGEAIRVIPGIELSGTVGEREAHVLGYFVDPTSSSLLRALADFRRQRIDRMGRFADRLTALGLPLTLEQILAETSGGAAGRPHVARAMVRRGYVASVGEAFERFLTAGCPTFVPKTEFSPEACIAVIRDAGGVASLAHPYGTGDPESFATRLKAVGLTGLEVEYGAYGEDQRAVLREIAARNGLVATGGSDYHGSTDRIDRGLGSGQVPLATVEDLARLASR